MSLPDEVKQFLNDFKIKINDYSEGPIPEKLYGGADMWVFGKTVKNREVYIKITMGPASQSAICISFPIAEHKMSYPLKKSP